MLKAAIDLAEPSLRDPASQLCTANQFLEPEYHRLCAEFGQKVAFHRKQWEYVYILRCLEKAGMLAPGKRGGGFGCGKEPLAAVMVARGAQVLCTDIRPKQSGDAYWGASDVRDYFYGGICSWDMFSSMAQFREVDMNAIPEDLGQFDFLWSSCALEHIGSLQHGIDFVLNASKHLIKGGVAVHTTEYNISSDDETYESPGLSLYRKQDMLRLQALVEKAGDRLLPFNFDPGAHELDLYIDAPPYDRSRHVKLLSEGYALTSIGFVIVKG